MSKNYSSNKTSLIDLGCGTGITTTKLACEFNYTDFHAIDIANALLQKAKDRLSPLGIHVYEADFDHLSHINHTFDILFSNMALQWSAHLDTTLHTLKSHINPNGILAFSIPLNGTFIELHNQYASHTFMEDHFIKEQLDQNGYELLISHDEKMALTFTSTLAALLSIKYVGANHVTQRLHQGLCGKNFLHQLSVSTLTYVIGYFVARLR